MGRGATRHDVLPGGRYPGQDLYDVLLARCERAEAKVEVMRSLLERLLDTALPASMLRVPPSLAEAIKEVLSTEASEPTQVVAENAQLRELLARFCEQVPRGCMHVPTHLVEAAKDALRDDAAGVSVTSVLNEQARKGAI